MPDTTSRLDKLVCSAASRGGPERCMPSAAKQRVSYSMWATANFAPWAASFAQGAATVTYRQRSL